MLDRIILHCDCNSFFASVELLSHPELINLPVAVCGSTDNRHGIILAKNEAAKKFKVATAETVWQAKRKCPNLNLLPPHHNLYSKYSKIINEIYSRFSDRVEPFGIDESWIDITGTWHLFGKSPTEVANLIRATVKAETRLTISVGVSFNKVFAKLGSDYKKPDATTVFDKNNYKYLIWPMPVNSLLFVGKVAEQVLGKLDIRNIGQLAAADIAILTAALGKQGEQLLQYAKGEDDAPVALYGEATEVKSVGNGLTFKRNLVSDKDIAAGVLSLADEVATRLRQHALFCNCVQVAIKDTDLKSINRQTQTLYPTHLASDIALIATKLINDNWTKGKPIRMLTITAQNLTNGDDGFQTSILSEKLPDKKREAIEKSLDTIRDKYGKNSISSCNIIKNDLGLGELKFSNEGEE